MMELWYALVDLLPFEWAQPGSMYFMKNALLAGLVISPLFGILSTMVVHSRMSFFSDALGHSAFTGMAIGALCGFSEPTWAAVLFSLVFALLFNFVRRRTRLASDTVIGVFSSTAVALGIFISTLGSRSFTKFNSLLIGDILSVEPGKIGLLALILPLVLALAARRFYPRAIAWPRKLKDVTFGIWVVILVLIAANASYDISSRDGISERVLEQIGAVSLLVCGINFGLGHLLGGRTRAAECSQALGQKNTTLSIYLALTYASPIAALGPTFYVLWHNLWNAWQLYRASERKRRNG